MALHVRSCQQASRYGLGEFLSQWANLPGLLDHALAGTLSFANCEQAMLIET